MVDVHTVSDDYRKFTGRSVLLEADGAAAASVLVRCSLGDVIAQLGIRTQLKRTLAPGVAKYAAAVLHADVVRDFAVGHADDGGARLGADSAAVVARGVVAHLGILEHGGRLIAHLVAVDAAAIALRMVVDDLAAGKARCAAVMDTGAVARTRSLRRQRTVVVGHVARHRYVSHAEAGIVASDRDAAAVAAIVIGATGDKAAGDGQRALVVLVGVGVVLPKLSALTVINQFAVVLGLELLGRATVDDHLGLALDADDIAVAGAVELCVRRGEAAIDHVAVKVEKIRAVVIVEHQVPIVLGVPVAQDIDGDRIDLIRIVGAREHVGRAVEHVLVAVAVVAARIGPLAAHVGNGVGTPVVVVCLGLSGLHRKRSENESGARERKASRTTSAAAAAFDPLGHLENRKGRRSSKAIFHDQHISLEFHSARARAACIRWPYVIDNLKILPAVAHCRARLKGVTRYSHAFSMHALHTYRLIKRTRSFDQRRDMRKAATPAHRPWRAMPRQESGAGSELSKPARRPTQANARPRRSPQRSRL